MGLNVANNEVRKVGTKILLFARTIIILCIQFFYNNGKMFVHVFIFCIKKSMQVLNVFVISGRIILFETKSPLLLCEFPYPFYADKHKHTHSHVIDYILLITTAFFIYNMLLKAIYMKLFLLLYKPITIQLFA